MQTAISAPQTNAMAPTHTLPTPEEQRAQEEAKREARRQKEIERQEREKAQKEAALKREQENWTTAIRMFNTTYHSFPTDEDGWKEQEGGETHTFKGKNAISHSLVSYVKEMRDFTGYKLTAKYNYCPDCKEVRNKVMILVNHQLNRAHLKWFLKKGKAN